MFDQQYLDLTQSLNRPSANLAPLERFKAEIEFAKGFAEVFPDRKPEWQGLIISALERVQSVSMADIEQAVQEAEKILAPIGRVAKEYTIHCCGHAHIDMNWMWDWPETVSVTHDTFATINTLMDECPEFHFSQSQASTYEAMREYCPEIFEMVKKRIKEGRWEVTASMWVEGDKNIVSGESLCRHLLYTRSYFKETMGLEPEDVTIDWSPDTFGHARTVPSILSRGGVKRYYHMLTGPELWLYKWRSPDGSEILVFHDLDRTYGYNGPIYSGVANLMVNYVKQTGQKHFLSMYGVGDHGGGPTRKDFRTFRDISEWPIFPTYKLSKTDTFFSAIEAANPDLPVIDTDLNFIFDGCYTSQSNIKKANRVSELVLPQAETLALIGGYAGDLEYPEELLTRAWRWTLFNHFHDILPGSGVAGTYHYSQGLFQEIQATSNSISTRALRALGQRIDTASVVGSQSGFGYGLGDGLGGGAGDPSLPGPVTTLGAGGLSAEPVLAYNPKPWKRSGVVCAKVWNKRVNDALVIARDAAGAEVKAQVIERGNYWGHDFTTLAFPVKDVPAVGYRVYAIDEIANPPEAQGASAGNMIGSVYGAEFVNPSSDKVIENEYLRVELDFPSGAIKSLIDKETGFDYVPKGKLLGLLEIYKEAPHGMTAWVIGQAPEVTPLVSGAHMQVVHRGPHRVSVKATRTYNQSSITLEIGLDSGSRSVDFHLKTRWVEIGTPSTGVPMLRAAFPLNVSNGIPTYEIPFGSQERPQSGQEIPALKWADLSGETDLGTMGATLVNDSKYGHQTCDNTLRLTLLRSSYDPDPLPEVADHDIRFAIVTHKGACSAVDATQAGENFNQPLTLVNIPVQQGSLPVEHSFVEVLTPSVFVSSVKKAEGSDAVVIRMFEAEGKTVDARIRIRNIIKPDAKAVETDVLERPLSTNTARVEGDVLAVSVPAFGQATVKIG
ncbi:MAG: glycoside hydrolase family 38 C-terminal domain-containing protein [Armatimonadota bacterium]